MIVIAVPVRKCSLNHTVFCSILLSIKHLATIVILSARKIPAISPIMIHFLNLRFMAYPFKNEGFRPTPVPFDIARQVRVFEPYIQYVEINLRGCYIQRHKVPIPKSIQGLGESKEIENRLRTTFDLIEKNSNISSKSLDKELKLIRDNFTRSLGKPWGRVLLKGARSKFDERIVEFRKKIVEHKKNVEKELAEHLEKSKNRLSNIIHL